MVFILLMLLYVKLKSSIGGVDKSLIRRVNYSVWVFYIEF